MGEREKMPTTVILSYLRCHFSFYLWLDNFPLRLVERELHDVVGPEVEDVERTLGALLVK